MRLTLPFLAVLVTLIEPTNLPTQAQTLEQLEIETPGSFSISESSLAFASLTPGEVDLSLQTAESNGTVTGVVRYPSDYLPAMRIYAIRTDGSAHYKTTTRPNQSRFKIFNVPPGKYFIVAYTDEAAGMSGAWSRAVPCGLKVTCRDHSLIRVTVAAGRTAGGINIGDWYAAAGAFPTEPSREQETATASRIESTDFRNFTYSRGTGQSLVLRAGEEAGSPSDAARFVSARYVDFDSDSRKEALITIATGTKGASGYSEEYFVYAIRNGTLRQIFHESRQKPLAMRVNGRSIVIVAPFWRSNDAGCCPSAVETSVYRWRGNGFVRVSRKLSPSR